MDSCLRYVDALNEIFARAEHRIDELKLMCIASAELDGFAIDMLNKTNKSSQFANIDNLSSIEAQHLLRAEMIRNEQNDQRIEMLTKRCVSLERRLAVCDTAEVFYSNLKHECFQMEDKLKKLLEEFGDVERRRIERCTKLLELNAKIERDYELKVTQNEALGAQLRSLNTTFASLKQLRDRIAQLERDSMKQRKSLRDAEEKLKEEMIKSERERKNAEMLEQQIGREKDIAQEKWNINEQKLTHLHVKYENGTKRMEEMYERKVSKLRDEVMRVKHERDELVIKVCDYQHHNRTFKQQLIKNAQLKLADTCQKAVTEFAGTQFSSFGPFVIIYQLQFCSFNCS
ncbi:unnamed protein product [Anisakis simplex]|uniref:Cilia- and flagella-associated protein 157 n=1 Tax=Anisakis simplex TaxID=6269 RepID=A0A0M3K2G5_ANISI|nr:unnamed protein product [Anisakis simplex]